MTAMATANHLIHLATLILYAFRVCCLIEMNIHFTSFNFGIYLNDHSIETKNFFSYSFRICDFIVNFERKP